ncbi:MAG: TonB-dependent receptor [candidate division KSB1 bacterium]|nr:TonB-dependent receptor [candidate division KSB1 bacterium]MDZ7287765.1 TonB-dependent receptor [candidate division KSB1 bacterium]MDZ7299895.1 TonB-dependent receptor [candidate division KSB1 bacterium]MDZ7309290.1 TonB-dependent receptor [candidate division KSB1 bacterium]MDZ7350894.1 TonB-dependent receptor [candidate division KSB1 bacterium]
MRSFPTTTVLLFALGALEVAAAQTTVKIAGRVLSASGEPLPGAHVWVLPSGMGAVADASGHFAIENLFAGEYDVQASFVGYEPQIRQGVVVQKDFVTTVDFKLQPKIITLDEIVIEAAADQSALSAFQHKITAAQMQQSGARNVAELLRTMPGVDISEEAGGSGRKRISIRGSNPSQVLVLLDGVPLNDPLTGEVDLNQIPLAGVAEIRVLKGGHSSRHGSGALGGVVEISSQQTPRDEIRVSGQLGEYGARGIRSSLAGNFRRLNAFFSFENLAEEGDYPYAYQRPDGTTVEETRLNAGFVSRNYSGRLGLDLTPHSFQFHAHLHRSQRGLPGLVFAWTPYAEAMTDRRILLGHYNFRSRAWHGQLLLSQHLNATEFHNAPPPDAPLRFRTVPPYHTKYRILSHRAAFETTLRFGQGQAIFLQTSLQRDDFKDEDLLFGSPGPIRQTSNLAGSMALRSEWQLPKPEFLTRLTLTPAVRFDFISFRNGARTRNDRQTSPNLGLLISRNRRWLVSFRANWGASFRAPTFADLFYQDFRVRGNANLLPEKSRDVDAGLQLGLPWLGRLDLSGGCFRHELENLIVWELGSFATWQPSNTAALLQGWEWEASWQTWQNRLALNLSQVILHAVDKSGRRTTHGKRLTYRPEHSTKAGLEMHLKKIVLTYHKRLVGPRFVTPANTVSLPAYDVDDATLLFKQEWQKLEVNCKASVFNLFDAAYEIVERAPLPGRHWRVEVELVY